MTDYYVHAHSGNDANSGLSAGLAKKTFAAAYALAVSGDTVYVAGAFTDEFVHPYNAAYAKALKVIGNPVAVFDFYDGRMVMNYYGYALSEHAHFENIIFRNHAGIVMWSGATKVYSFVNCRFENINTLFRINNYTDPVISLRNCILDNVFSLGDANNRTLKYILRNNTFVDCVYLYEGAGPYSSFYFHYWDSIVGLKVGIRQPSSGNFALHYTWLYARLTDYNAFDFTRYGTVIETTLGADSSLAALIARGASYDFMHANSKDVDLSAHLLDINKKALRTKPSSSLRKASSTGGPIGATDTGYAVSSNVHSSIWTGGTHTNTYMDSDGNLRLTRGASSGTWKSPVIDLGGSFLNLKRIEFGINPQSKHFGYTSRAAADYRIRGSASFFAADAGSPAWVAVPMDGNLAGLVTENQRYWQLEVTLNNGA